ncbi:phospholipase D family protein [Halobacteriovorax sp. HLS]|uniref:phospholipase D family protein n=1 Tax=Halobacteriovorax sp. HLS TaxID=2234000 RepID=UPI000FD8CE75|nr:phospholipase D family protein [Halobacteriovorax sp. HLS]
MFSELNRKSFFEEIKAPHGYEIEYCIGTTFSMDLECLTQMCIESYKRRFIEKEISVYEAIEAIENFSSKSCIIVQNCRINELPIEEIRKDSSKKAKLYVLLDSCVEQVPLKVAQSAFHPKVWFVKYTAHEKEESFWKLIVMSKNLTKSVHWDISSTMVGQFSENKTKNTKIKNFFTYLLEESSAKNSKKNSEHLKQAIEELDHIQFSDPQGLSDGEFYFKWGSLEKGKSFKIDDSYQKIVVVSPFLSESRLSQLNEHPNAYLITGRADLSKIKPYEKLHKRTYVVNSLDLELHAKIYLGLNDEYTDLFIGSQNFTNAAWFNENVEATINYHAPKSHYDAFKKAFIFQDEKAKKVQNWLIPYDSYVFDSELESESELTQINERKLSYAQQLLSTCEVKINVSKKSCSISLEGSLDDFPEEVTGSLKVIGIDDKLELKSLFANKFETSNYQKSEISSFVILRLELDGQVKSFCTVAITNIQRVSRNKKIFKELIKDWASFWEYLGVILDIDTGGPKTKLNKNSSNKRTENVIPLNHNRGVLPKYIEPIMLGGANDPELIEKVDRALDVLPKDKITSEVEEFLKFWTQYKLAYAEFKNHG